MEIVSASSLLEYRVSSSVKPLMYDRTVKVGRVCPKKEHANKMFAC